MLYRPFTYHVQFRKYRRTKLSPTFLITLYNWFPWWWAQGLSKHVENWNKYIRKNNCTSSWLFTRNYPWCKSTKHKILQTLSETYLFLSRSGRNMIEKNYIGLHVKYPLFLSDLNKSWIFSADFRKNTPIPNFVKVLSMGAKLFHEGGRTDMMQLIVALNKFGNGLEKCLFLCKARRLVPGPIQLHV